MAKEITVEQGQCLMDIAIQYCGKAEALFEIAELNSLSTTEVVAPGSKLSVPEPYDAEVVKYLASKSAIPATGDAAESQEALLEGIDYWALEIDFVVQ